MKMRRGGDEEERRIGEDEGFSAGAHNILLSYTNIEF